ncbi:MAG: hypothetical protein ACRDPH_12360 [Marmoricola sp.]
MKRTTDQGPREAMSHTPTDKAPPFNRLEALTAVAVIGVLALALGLAALASPTRSSTTKKLDYTQSGKFGYHAHAASGSAYGGAGLRTGEPILTSEAGPVTAAFTYHLDASSAANLQGVARMVATVSSHGLTRSFPVAAPKHFTGPRTRVTGRLPVAAIQRYVARTTTSLGDTSLGTGTTTVTLHPRVRITGDLAGHRLAARYSPHLGFTVDGSTLGLAQDSAGAGPAGADLTPSKAGKLAYPTTKANTLPLPVLHPGVGTARVLGLGIAALCLLVGLWLARPLLRGGGPKNEAARIRTLYGSQIVEVSALSVHEGPVADVAGMDALADLAKRYESMIMHVSGDDDTYLVWDNGMLYRYRLPAAEAPEPSRRAHSADAPGRRPSRPRLAALRGAEPEHRTAE